MASQAERLNKTADSRLEGSISDSPARIPCSLFAHSGEAWS